MLAAEDFDQSRSAHNMMDEFTCLLTCAVYAAAACVFTEKKTSEEKNANKSKQHCFPCFISNQ